MTWIKGIFAETPSMLPAAVQCINSEITATRKSKYCQIKDMLVKAKNKYVKVPCLQQIKNPIQQLDIF